MTGPATDPTKSRDELTTATESLVAGWAIPENIPHGVCTAIVPGTECIDGARLLARTLHTLVLRSRPRTLVLVTGTSCNNTRLRAIGTLSTSLGEIAIDERLAARIASLWPGDLDIIQEDSDEESLPSLHRIAPLMAQVLIPGCRVVPMEIPTRPGPDFDPIRLGQELGSQLKSEVGSCLIAAGTLSPRKEGQVGGDVQEDASILKYMLDPEAVDLAGLASVSGLSDWCSLVMATAHAVERGRRRGHLLEHGMVDSGQQKYGAAAVVL
ncbi:MAG: hypothetical protein VX764_06265 [Planctomycetota bacterium]|nr:hypothetical protein [Planctomycetota bacterium]